MARGSAVAGKKKEGKDMKEKQWSAQDILRRSAEIDAERVRNTKNKGAIRFLVLLQVIVLIIAAIVYFVMQ